MGKLAPIAIIALLIGGLLAASCTAPSHQDLDQHVRSIAKSHKFSILKWEFAILLNELRESFVLPTKADINDAGTVREYFTSIEPDKSLEDKAEIILTKQIRAILAEEGILNPFLPVKFIFPPLNFKFESPPNLLVISPRDEIRLLRRTTLDPNLTTKEKGAIESQVDALDVSSLVVGLGGVGFTYPTMIAESANMRFAIDTAIEEWFHQYMAFRPLGFRYLLDVIGVRSDYDIITMNETVAGIVSKEIGAKVYQKYYAPEAVPEKEPDSEFNREMRAIRIQVDQYLAQGEIAEAEEFMREKRDFLVEKGYYLRKLNQAYFAFHGTYADEPTSVSPIGRDLKELRGQSQSLKKFLDKVAGMTSYKDLKDALRNPNNQIPNSNLLMTESPNAHFSHW